MKAGCSQELETLKKQRATVNLVPRLFPGGLLGLIFFGHVPLASQSPYPIKVYSVTSYRPHLSHFWANM